MEEQMLVGIFSHCKNKQKLLTETSLLQSFDKN